MFQWVSFERNKMRTPRNSWKNVRQKENGISEKDENKREEEVRIVK